MAVTSFPLKQLGSLRKIHNQKRQKVLHTHTHTHTRTQIKKQASTKRHPISEVCDVCIMSAVIVASWLLFICMETNTLKDLGMLFHNVRLMHVHQATKIEMCTTDQKHNHPHTTLCCEVRIVARLHERDRRTALWTPCSLVQARRL